MKDIDRILLLLALVILLFSVSGNIKGWKISFGFAACRAAPANPMERVLEQSQYKPTLGLDAERWLQGEIEKERNKKIITPEWAKPKE